MHSWAAHPGQGLPARLDIPESDPTLQKLQEASFDPVDFLNSSIPNFSPPPGPPNSFKSPKIPQIQETSAQVQGLLSKLNAQNIRYSNTLTQLADEILRSGSRLAYEVEILRGDSNGLYELLTDTLLDDLKKLGIWPTENGLGKLPKEGDGAAPPVQSLDNDSGRAHMNGHEPDFIPQLRMLSQVKVRLEEVINVFGEAMEWPLAPSELSITSSLISVSAPEPGSDTHTREEKAREAAKKLRSEVNNLLNSNGAGYAGLEAAARRIESLRSLATVWKGTAEEKARTKFVDGLVRMIDERRKMLEANPDSGRQGTGSAAQRSFPTPERPAATQVRSDRNANDGNNQAGGILRNLQRLRDDFYLE